MKRYIRAAETQDDFKIMLQQYKHRRDFNNADDTELADLLADLKNKGVAHDVYQHKTGGGCTVFHDDMQQSIRSSTQDSLDIVSVVADIMKDPAGRKLYAKLLLIDPDVIDGYVEGVVDALHLTGHDDSGFDRLYDMILEHGIEYVWEAMQATQGTKVVK